MKILIAFDWFLRLVVDGQARALKRLGHDVRLLCRDHAYEFGGNPTERAEILGGLRNDGIEVLQIPGRRFTLAHRGRLREVRRDLAAWAPDVVSAHQNNDPRLWWLVRGIPVVYTIHDPRPHPGHIIKVRERLAAALWLRSADLLVVHGDELIAPLSRGVRGGPVRVIPHGIAVQRAPQPKPRVPVVLLFGRLEPYKGLDVLVAAMQHIWSVNSEVRLVIAGRGPAARNLPRDPRLDLREGYIPEREIPDLLRTASVVALPYTEASQSGVGLLAIANGIPTVVTRTGALPELAVTERYIAKPGDAMDLADRLLDALGDGDPDRRTILEFARSKFSWSVVAEAYVAAFEEVRAGATGPGLAMTPPVSG